MNCNSINAFHCNACVLPNKSDTLESVIFLQIEDVLAIDHTQPSIKNKIEQIAIGKGKQELDDKISSLQMRVAESTLLNTDAVNNFMTLLQRIEAAKQRVGIVIIGQWRVDGTTEEIVNKMFAYQPFSKYIIGRTIQINNSIHTQAEEIKEWITSHKVNNYVIITNNCLSELEDHAVSVQHKAFEAVQIKCALRVLAIKPPLTTKYPSQSTVEKLNSPFEVKNWWVYNEWDPRCQFSQHIQYQCQKREDLDPKSGKAIQSLVETVFQAVRGQFILWGEQRESAKWKKVVVEKLELAWIKDNVEVLYPSSDKFEVCTLEGIVLWRDPTKPKYQLLEGNHRISAWLNKGEPSAFPSILFIGKSKIQPLSFNKEKV